jgi:hypothetical protein
VDGKNHLGIYISSHDATVVCVDTQGPKITACFGVSTRGAEEVGPAGIAGLASLIAQGCAQRNIEFAEASVALDCEMFLQHTVRSEFTDPKQIASTVRFDTEEAIATDVADVAIAFRVAGQDEHGSKLSVFTARQKVLSEVIAALQSNNMDPVSVEPDVSCLSRFVLLGKPAEGTMVAMLSEKNGYFIIPKISDGRNASAVRTMIIGQKRNRSDLLAREIPMTTALFASVEAISRVVVVDSADEGAAERAASRVNFEMTPYEAAEKIGQFAQERGEDVGTVELAIAYGAGLYHLEKEQSVNFRNDFMPYQGGKALLEKRVQFLGVAAAVLMIVLGLFTTMLLFQQNGPAKRLRKKFEGEYKKVMRSKLPNTFNQARTNLLSRERQMRDLKAGVLGAAGDKSLTAKLTLVLEALNKCAKQTDLNIERISVSDKNVSIKGDTPSHLKTQAVLQSIKSNNLELTTYHYETEANGRESFEAQIAVASGA